MTIPDPTADAVMAEVQRTSPPPAKRQKLGGYDFYKSIGSPKWVVAPMVDQSELAWRMLSRSPLPSDMAGPSTTVTTPQGKVYTRHPGGAHLVYTPMIHAKVFLTSKPEHKGGDSQFDLTRGEEGSDEPLAGIEGGDRPLFVQFCANDPDVLLEAAKKVEHRCDAVDINFGCPQGIARRGYYGSFLQDDWELIRKLISTLHENLAVPVTAKFRIFPDLERTLAYAKMMEAAGAQILTCHGRTREMKGQMTGLADWEVIREVKKAVKIPVFANGNILYREDVDRCLEMTGCDGVMTAEGNLSNPAIFLPPDHKHFHPSIFLLARRYLDIVSSLKTRTGPSAVKSHLFRILKPALDVDDSMRALIGGTPVVSEGGLKSMRDIVDRLEASMQGEIEKAGADWVVPPINPETGYRTLPPFVVQPVIRAIPESSEVGGNEDFVPNDTATTNTNGNGNGNNTASTSRAASPPPNPLTPPKCIHSVPKPCAAIAAGKCDTKACLVHCRELRAVAAGMNPDEAAAKSAKGELVGMGCEAHESKVRAKKERLADKRKYRAEAKEEYKRQKVDQTA